MGTKYSQNRHDTRTHISSDILIVATKYQQIINQMLERGLPRSNFMGLFLKCTKCSWAVRIDDYNDYTINDYNKVDEIRARTFHNIAQPKAIPQEDLDGPRSKEMIQSILALMAASIKNHYGFGLILPGLSFQTQKLLASNKIDPRFKKLKHSIKSENEKMDGYFRGYEQFRYASLFSSVVGHSYSVKQVSYDLSGFIVLLAFHYCISGYILSTQTYASALKVVDEI
ncbi:Hypothetical_protein [Hexamita inflata]|uniref:Hypothetical_protein n=1 Tax=Hexamita inflata TaxID=28002 RepID=A0AA86NFS6_9EUKA|nr:Hypothetical protein HINF_LOCUS6717 [Hexamita inflata]